MPDRLAELRAEILAAHRDLLGALDGFSAEDFQRSTPNEGWTVKDTLAHLCTIEDRLRSQIRSVLDTIPFPTENVNDFNDRKVTERRSWTVDQLRTELEQERAITLALLDSLCEEDLDRFFDHPTRGHMTPERVLRNIPDHMRRHTQEIAATVQAGA